MDTRTGLPVVGMIGGGQLARMTHQAAIALGQSLRVLATDPDESAALVAADVQLGRHTDLAALRDFAKACDVVTFDHEHVPGEHIRALAAEGHPVFPGADALHYAQDKHAMRRRLTELGAPVPRWAPLHTAAELVAFGLPAVVKTARGGYDGRGVFVVEDPAEISDLLASGAELIVEEKVQLRRELAVQVARSPYGQVAVYPVVETVQRDGICVEVLAPAPNLSEDLALEAQQLAIRIAHELGVVGMLAVELFEVAGGGPRTGEQSETPAGLVINELAMRPHNSGHWTIEGARTSQFEQHLRAVLDYPMGDTTLAAPAVVMVNVLGGPEGGIGIDERVHHLMAAEPGVKLHLYGKQTRPGRKIGHVTALGADLDDCRARAARAAHWLTYGKAMS
ncbi:N5-carboxyaminoimidazole ribonucleotide synthase [Catellatospora sp. TT07R-123]|uniref:5-(carboxyamino)imidazole ribonucleotide synthase n=1 Tax=Catellatospora sp. TT07R-123 TaxID=2733863 RepID=UPI001AFF1D64|nr:5-(carboxyamino)imidazole ribonucleotide synthase [Catellatospora sp. TT07R-123]GHJ45940.1 N5-carboxyaminoimidazole ribonucleotide synthase [Catellatospora sp. TT07R-123]